MFTTTKPDYIGNYDTESNFLLLIQEDKTKRIINIVKIQYFLSYPDLYINISNRVEWRHKQRHEGQKMN